MFEKKRERVIHHCFRFMISKENRELVLRELGINQNLKNHSLAKAADALKSSRDSQIELKALTQAIRHNWKPTMKKFHLENLRSGALAGHGWHGTRPSALHLSLQGKVREVHDTKSLRALISIGADIAKHEYFMVATHDLLETTIIESFDEVIPSIANKGVTDFIFKGIPYDLKATDIPKRWTVARIRADPRAFVMSMYENADTERIREQAKGSFDNWALNKFYVVVDERQWSKNPQNVLKRFVSKCKRLSKPMILKVQGLRIRCHLVIV